MNMMIIFLEKRGFPMIHRCRYFSINGKNYKVLNDVVVDISGQNVPMDKSFLNQMEYSFEEFCSGVLSGSKILNIVDNNISLSDCDLFDYHRVELISIESDLFVFKCFNF